MTTRTTATGTTTAVCGVRKRADFVGWKAWGAWALGACGVVFPSDAAAAPAVFWASDPVRPNETVLIQGHELDGAVVEIARLPGNASTDGAPRKSAAALAEAVERWVRPEVLQSSPQSLKFVLPAADETGVYVCRVARGGASAPAFFLNAPQPWWIQGDRGRTASPGGWLRVLGKSLAQEDAHPHRRARVRFVREGASAVELAAQAGSDGFSTRYELPSDFKTGTYNVFVHNGGGGDGVWSDAGALEVEADAWPDAVFNVLEPYGPDAPQKMRETLAKYRIPPDRTEGVQAALKKAKENGGGVVYFPAGKYAVQGELKVPPKTILRGEGMGLVVLWWGRGRFTLDGGDLQNQARDDAAPKPPSPLISGRDFGVEEMSLYLPLEHGVGVQCDSGLRMRKVRVRVDHLWAKDGSKRPEGVAARLGDEFSVEACDVDAKGTGLVPGRFGRIVDSTIRAGKVNTPLGGARELIVEGNTFVSSYPTAYQNIAGVGRNLYYAHNRHLAEAVHQADYSFTFDAGGSAYWGKVAKVSDLVVELADDPRYPDWAPEKHKIWKEALVVVQEGRGAGQWRNVVANEGRRWRVDRPFDVAPDETSTITIVPMNGRALVVQNGFEDANWVNAGYGTAIDVVYSENTLSRCAQLLNYGVPHKGDCQPCWYVQYLGNDLREGHTTVETGGQPRDGADYKGVVTNCTVHRRHTFHADSSGEAAVFGVPHDVVFEGCTFLHPMNRIRIDGGVGVLLRNNDFPGGPPRYVGKRLADALVLPAPERPALERPALDAAERDQKKR